MTGEDAFVELPRNIDALLRGCQRTLDVPCGEGCEAAIEKIPDEPLGVFEEPRRLDCSVEHLAGLGHAPLDPESGSEHRRDEWEQVPLARSASDPQSSFGVSAGGLEV